MLTRTTTTTETKTETVISTTITEDVPCEGCPNPIKPWETRAVCDFTGRGGNVSEHLHMTCYFSSLAHAIPGWEG